MKKLFILLAAFVLMINVASSQGVDDRAVIPVAVTLNSILRLNVVSGGNIEFNFNTLQDYTLGIANTPAYNTAFTVASSVDWEVNMYSEDPTLIGTDDGTGGNTLTLDNIGYRVTKAGTGADTDYNIPSLSATVALSATETPIVGLGTTSNAGDVLKNSFIINWRCGTQEAGMNGTSILGQSVAADRYATNVFLILTAL
jgi:hypothetical protein